MMNLRLVTLTSLFLLTGCAVGPNYKRPHLALPASYTAKQPSVLPATHQTKFGLTQRLKAAKDIPAQWWELFHSKPLNDLVMASFQHNPNVSVARAALHGALESIYAQRGALYPFFGLSFSPSVEKQSRVLASLLTNNQYDFGLYTGQVFVSYSPDVFGGTRRQLESLVAEARYQRLQLEATYLTLASNVVNAAIQEAALREQIKVTQQIIVSQTRILMITRKQQHLGAVALADISARAPTLVDSPAA